VELGWHLLLLDTQFIVLAVAVGVFGIPQIKPFRLWQWVE
jgi:hypothetical protein